MVWVGSVFAIALFSGAAFADDGPQPVLSSPPSLLYPRHGHGAHGDVVVQVIVDLDGEVTSATVQSGEPLFHAESLVAARRLRFEPGKAGTTLVTFHFAPPNTPEEHEEPIEEIVVHANEPAHSDPHARTTLGVEALESARGEDLTSTLEQVSGVVSAGGTAAVSKPVIRGQTERRLMLLTDGVRHESQRWGPDHAPEIDPFSAGEITVIKGAGAARYGPDAIGGVVLVRPPPMRVEDGVGGTSVLAAASNGRSGYGALRVDGASEATGNSVRLEGTYARSASLKAPDYVLGNTASEVVNLGGSFAHTYDGGSLRATLHHHAMRAGIFYGVQTSTPDAFEAQLDARPANTALWTSSYAIDLPTQQVTHDQGALHWLHDLAGGGDIAVVYAYQGNHRQETEPSRGEPTGPQYDFLLRTHGLEAVVQHGEVDVRGVELRGGLGVQGSFQENVYTGLSLIPNFRSVQGGLFGFETAALGRVDVELGGRLDGQRRTAFLDDQDFDEHARRGTLGEEDCTEATERWRCPTAYSAASATMGAVWHAVPSAIDLKAELSSASRFPSIDELYLVGSAPTLPVFAVGSPGLGVETTRGGSVTVGVEQHLLQGEVSAFGQHTTNFANFAPEIGTDGQPLYDVTIRGAFPRFATTPIGARFVGGDGVIDLGPHSLFGLRLSGAVVRGTNSQTGAFLVGVPPERATIVGSVRPYLPGSGFRDLVGTISVEAVGTQRRTNPVSELAPPPSGYTLMSAGLTARVPMAGPRELRLGLEVRNVFDVGYRDYMSLLRYYTEEPGRDLRARLSFDF